MTTNTMRSDSDSVPKSGRARLTNRPRMLGATAASTKYKSATTTQNIKTSPTGCFPAASAQHELRAAEAGNLDHHPVARCRILDRDHAAGHDDHPAAQWCSSCREPGERVQRMAHHIAATAAADLLPVDREPGRSPSQVLGPPTGHRRPEHHSRIPCIAGDHRRSVEPLVIIVQILDQLDCRHAALDRRGDLAGSAALRQVVAQPKGNLGFDPEAAVVRRCQFGSAVMDLLREDRAIAGLADPAEFLHDGCCKPDLVAGDGAPSSPLFDFPKCMPNGVSFVEVCRRKIGRQYFDRLAAAKQFNDAPGFFPHVKCGHLYSPRVFYHGGTENAEMIFSPSDPW